MLAVFETELDALEDQMDSLAEEARRGEEAANLLSFPRRRLAARPPRPRRLP